MPTDSRATILFSNDEVVFARASNRRLGWVGAQFDRLFSKREADYRDSPLPDNPSRGIRERDADRSAQRRSQTSVSGGNAPPSILAVATR